MAEDPWDQKRRLDQGGYAIADVPAGFETTREPHQDAPLSARGKFIFYGILTLVILGGLVGLFIEIVY